MKISEIKNIAKNIDLNKYKDNYDYVGIRVQDNTFDMVVGSEVNHTSSVWDDGNETDLSLNGICALSVENLISEGDKYDDKYTGYDGNVAIILGSARTEYGEDKNELVMYDAVVLVIING